jgi:hypothetical protein
MIMDASDKERFQANYIWFNQFFKDLQQLLEAISKALINQFGWETNSKNWYYEKSNYQPSIPGYYMTALGGSRIAVQLYAVLDTMLLQDHPTFKNEPSLIVIVHSRPDRVLWTDYYGLRVIENKQVTQVQHNEKVITGEILTGDGKGTQYFSFQVTLDAFRIGNEINKVIQEEIVDILRGLPDRANG